VDLSRRKMLSAMALASLSLSGCESLIGRYEEAVDPLPEQLGLAQGDAQIDPAFHLLSRAAYGPRPGDVDYVRRIGTAAWIEEQLEPQKIDDRLGELRTRRFESVLLDPASCYDFKKEILRRDLTDHTLLRAVYSKRQLFEVMVGFWSDHFNINLEKGDCIYLKGADDRTVIRNHCLGKFKDLVKASALSPAMLVYLDGAENRKVTAQDVPNENYGRELMELHTLGVNGGYTQKDVSEAARALTGWTLTRGWGKGKVEFRPHFHDDGAKEILGVRLPAGGGAADLDRLIDIVSAHSSTARHIAYKLCRHFVGDEPPSELVGAVAETFIDTDGDIKAMLRKILNAPQFYSAAGRRIKRPMQFIASALRAMRADVCGRGRGELISYLNSMGQGLFEYPTPDGYPDDSAFWIGSLVFRWNFAMALAANSVPETKIDLERLTKIISGDDSDPTQVFAYLTGRRPNQHETAVLGDKQGSQLYGLILASPAFQRC
jgi:uncharacterized protein (DUF1800 family)